MSLDELNKYQSDPVVVIKDADGQVIERGVPPNQVGDGERLVRANVPPERGSFQIRRRPMETHLLYEVWIPHELFHMLAPDTIGRLQSDSLVRVALGLYNVAISADSQAVATQSGELEEGEPG